MTTNAQELFASAMRGYGTALGALEAAIARLPRYTATHRNRNGNVCAPEYGDVKVETFGVVQCVSYDPATNEARTDGFDDFGDIDGPEFLQCYACGKAFRTPEGMDWT